MSIEFIAGENIGCGDLVRLVNGKLYKAGKEVFECELHNWTSFNTPCPCCKEM